MDDYWKYVVWSVFLKLYALKNWRWFLIYPIVDFLVSSVLWTAEFGTGWACAGAIWAATGAAGMVVYMGGAPAGVRTGAVYPCCMATGTATTSNKQNETDFPSGTKTH